MCSPVVGGLSLFAGDLPQCGGYTNPLSLQVKEESCSVQHSGSWQMKLCVHRKQKVFFFLHKGA